MRSVAPEQLELGSARLESRPQKNPEPATNRRRSAAELLQTPGALLTRSHLRELGLERRAIDAVFRTLPVVALPGYSRDPPLIALNAPAAGWRAATRCLPVHMMLARRQAWSTRW